MALITDAVAQAWVDKLAENERALVAAMTGGFYAILTDSDDPDVELVMGPAANALDLAISRGDHYTNIQAEGYNALMAQLGLVSQVTPAKVTYATLDLYLAAVAWRVPVEFRNLAVRQGGAIAKAYVFDSVKELGTWNVTGSGTGTWTDGLALDATNTGGNSLEAYVPAGKTATSVALNVTCRKPDTTTEVKSITVNGAAGTTVAIGSAADLYTDITLVAATGGGSNLEQVKFRSKLDSRA